MFSEWTATQKLKLEIDRPHSAMMSDRSNVSNAVKGLGVLQKGTSIVLKRITTPLDQGGRSTFGGKRKETI